MIYAQQKGRHMLYNAIIFLYLLINSILTHLVYTFPNVMMPLRLPAHIIMAVLMVGAVISRMLKKPVPVLGIMLYIVMFASAALSVFFPENMPYLADIFIDYTFVKDVLLMSFLFLTEEDPELRRNQLTVVAIISLLVKQMRIMIGSLEYDFGYMNIGYGIASSWIIVVQGAFVYRNKILKMICLAFSAYFAVVVMVYGNRGAVLTIMLSLLVMMLVYLPRNRMIFLKLAIPVGLGIASLNLEPLIRMMGVVLHLNLSRSRNLRLLSAGIISYDSGRLPLYHKTIDRIFQFPVFGSGIGADRVATGGHYTHNIILELFADFGVLAGSAIYIWLLYIGYQMLFCCKDRAWISLFLPFYMHSMVMLFFSGTLWQTGNLFSAVMIYLVYQIRRTDGKRLLSGGSG